MWAGLAAGPSDGSGRQAAGGAGDRQPGRSLPAGEAASGAAAPGAASGDRRARAPRDDERPPARGGDRATHATPSGEARAPGAPSGEARAPTEARDEGPTPAGSDARTMRARRLLEDAIDRAEKAKSGDHRRGVRVDKYFGSKLPPVCARLGCYVTDDGKRFYCINPACQKHKRRETKHTRLGQPVKEQVVYFKCPRCDSRTIEMHLLANRYLCRTCRYNWER